MPDLNRLGAGQYGNAFARLYGMDDLGAVPTLAPEIMPTSSLWERDELWALVSGKLCTSWVTTTAVVGQTGYVVLANPATSNLLIIVERVINATATLLTWGSVLNGGTQANSPLVRDLRFASSTTAIGGGAWLSSGTSAGNAYSLPHGQHTGPFILPLTFILPPGTAFVVQGAAANTALNFTVDWRERPAAPGELTFR